MKNTLLIQIPTRQGMVSYSCSRLRLLVLLVMLTAVLGAVAWGIFQTTLSQSAANQTISQLEDQLANTQSKLAKNQKQLSAATKDNQQLNQELEVKNQQLDGLVERLDEVELVLGLQQPDQDTPPVDLETRVDTAAIDSAVRATLFRLLPNDSPVSYGRISSPFGSRINPVTQQRHFHSGIDLTCQPGETIHAAADGVVETIRPGNQGYGNYLTVRHTFGFMSLYAHMKSFKAKSGQFVSKGDVIGICGNTGRSTGPHLHFEVRFLGRALDPIHFIEWSPENFTPLFEQENKVQWPTLVNLIDNVVRLQSRLVPHQQGDTEVDLAQETADSTR